MSIFSKLWNWITGASKKVRTWLTFGKDLANKVKDFTDSPLLDALVKATPITWDDKALPYVRLAVGALIKSLGWADKKLEDFDDDARAVVLHTISAAAQKAKATSQGETFSIQTALTTAQLIYNPDPIEKELKG